jgi:mono/diheme cytochrome c family protein
MRGVAALCLALALPLLSPAARADTPSLVTQGLYVARAGDCAACHTAPGGKPFAGGLPIATPIGTIYSSNITPAPQTGIGSWTYDDFARLMRTGVAKDGSAVLPAMPYPSYARISEPDMKALYAYFMQGVQPVEAQVPRNTIPWPLSIRWPLRIWGWIFAPNPAAAEQATPASDTDAIARGAYLVEGLGHCGACHTARGLAMQERALTNASSLYLSGGGAVDGWIAPSLRGDNGAGLALWSEGDIVAFLKTGRNAHNATFGGMNDVIVNSTQYLTDADLHGIAAYLKSLPAKDENAAAYVYDDRESKALFNGDASARGAQIYVDRCAACHRTDGHGYERTFPALAGNPVLQTDNPTSAIHIVLSGGRLPATPTAPSTLVMAPYATVLTDQEVADVVTFIQTSWGNRGGSATADQVTSLRKTATPVANEGMTAISPQAQEATP